MKNNKHTNYKNIINIIDFMSDKKTRKNLYGCILENLIDNTKTIEILTFTRKINSKKDDINKKDDSNKNIEQSNQVIINSHHMEATDMLFHKKTQYDSVLKSNTISEKKRSHTKNKYNKTTIKHYFGSKTSRQKINPKSIAKKYHNKITNMYSNNNLRIRKKKLI